MTRGISSLAARSLLVLLAWELAGPAHANGQARDSAWIAQNAIRQVESFERELFSDRPRRLTPSARAAEASRLRPGVIEHLDAAGRRIPGDDWIVGQRVGLRIIQGWLPEAREVSASCEGTPWWCKALQGFVLHREGRVVEADIAFSQALAAMPVGVRCAWNAQLSYLLEDEMKKRFDSGECDARLALEEHLWWLATPFFMRQGHDRRTEHYSRLVAMQLHHMRLETEADITYDFLMPVCSDHHSELIRGGWPDEWWERGTSYRPPTRGIRLFPLSGAAMNPKDSDEADWDVLRGAVEWYAAPYEASSALQHQTALFLRGDSLLAVVAHQPTEGFVTAGVAMTSSADHSPILLQQTRSNTAIQFRGVLPHRRYLVSIESFASGRNAARARFGHGLITSAASGATMSDLLLVRPGSDHDSFETMLDQMLPTNALDRSQPVSVYWELYGNVDPERIAVGFSIEPEAPGVLRRVAERLGVVSERVPVAVRWQEESETDEPRSFSLDIGLSDLAPGAYTIRIDMSDGPDVIASANRRITVHR